MVVNLLPWHVLLGDDWNNSCLILRESRLPQQRHGDGTVPDFFGRVSRPQKKGGELLP